MKKEKTPFGNCLAQFRKKRFLTIKDASKLLGISPSYISAIEYGNREIPRGFRKLVIEKFKLTEREIDYMDRCIYITPANTKISYDDVTKIMCNLIDNITNDPDERKRLKDNLNKRLKELRN